MTFLKFKNVKAWVSFYVTISQFAFTKKPFNKYKISLYLPDSNLYLTVEK